MATYQEKFQVSLSFLKERIDQYEEGLVSAAELVDAAAFFVSNTTFIARVMEEEHTRRDATRAMLDELAEFLAGKGVDNVK